MKRFFDILLYKKLQNKIYLVLGLLLLSVFFNVSPAWADIVSCPSLTELQERYQGDCFSCEIVNVLLSSFMRAASKVYDVSKEAGNKLLFIGSALWIAFWVLKKLISLSNVDPAPMVNELIVFAGKVLVAYCFINAGIGALVNLAINPILGAGADFGSALLLESKNIDITSAPKAENQYQGPTDVISKPVMDKLLKLSEAISNEVATNLIIGNGLTCFAINNGYGWKRFYIPDIWLWLCGAFIWFAGFMMVLAVCYYLIDIPFRIGFAIMALPVVIGLWPFNVTKGKLASILMIAVNAAGTFLFLALAASYAVRLISEAFSVEGNLEIDGQTYSGKDALFKAFESDNVEFIENLFDFTGPGFLVILFCYIYGYKMISEITTSYPDKFFSGSMTASAGSPMHNMATAATMWATNKISAPFKTAAAIVANQAGKAATTTAKAAANVGIGTAGLAIGAAHKFVGTPLAKATGAWVNRQRALKDAADSLDSQNSLQNAGIGAKAGTKLGKFNAAVGLGLAKVADHMTNSMVSFGDTLERPGKKTFSRIGNAAVAGAKEWNQSRKELGDALIETGSAIAPEKLAMAMQNVKGLEKIGDTILQTKESMREQGQQNFEKSIDKFGQSTAKLANRFVNAGLYMQNAASQGGAVLQKLSAFNKENIKDVFTGKAILSAAQNLIAKSSEKTALDVERSKERLANKAMNFGAGFVDNIQLAGTDLREAASSLVSKKAFVNNARDVKETFQQFGSTVKQETGIKNSTLAGAAAATSASFGIAAARNLASGIKHGVDYVKEGEINGVMTAVGTGVVRPAIALGMALKDTASGTLESGYRLTEQTLLSGISLAKLAASPVANVGNSLTYGAMALGNSVAAVGSTALNGVGLVAGGLDLGYQYSKYVTRPVATVVGAPIRAAGAVVGFAAKAVDETFYIGYKSVDTLGMAGKTLGAGLNVGYHLVKDRTIAGQIVSKTFKSGSKTLGLAAKTLKLGRNIVLAAAGESIGESRTETKAERDENNRRYRQERQERRKEEQRKQQREQRQREEEERQREADEAFEQDQRETQERLDREQAEAHRRRDTERERQQETRNSRENERTDNTSRSRDGKKPQDGDNQRNQRTDNNDRQRFDNKPTGRSNGSNHKPDK